MLIRCPRCGFQQPKDKYCAQCGVDMENYRRPAVPLSRKILGNPAVQISVVLAIAGFVGLSLYQRKQRDIASRVTYLKSGAQVARSVSGGGATDADPSAPSADTALAPPETATDDSSRAAFAPPAPSSPGSRVSQEGGTSGSSAAGSAPPGAAAKTASNTKGGAVVRVFFAEVAAPALQEIWEQSRATGQFNQLADHFAGIVPDLGSKITASNRNIKVLAREQRPIEPGRAVQLFQGVHQGDPESEVGFTYYIELQETDGTYFRGALDLIRSWRDPGPGGQLGPSQKKIYPAVFELNLGSGFFMSGLLPRVSALAASEELINVSPFQILRSSAFRSQASESVLFLEFDRN